MVKKEIAHRLAKSEEVEKRVARDQEEVQNYIMFVVQDAGKPKKRCLLQQKQLPLMLDRLR